MVYTGNQFSYLDLRSRENILMVHPCDVFAIRDIWLNSLNAQSNAMVNFQMINVLSDDISLCLFRSVYLMGARVRPTSSTKQ